MAAAWAATDPAGALAAIIDWESDADAKGSMLYQIMDEWAGTDPRTAMDWLLARDANQLPNLVSPAFLNLAESDLADAEALVARLPSESARRNAQSAVFVVIAEQGNLDRTLAAFAELDVRDQTQAAAYLAERLSLESPQRSLEWFMGLDEEVRKDSFDWTLTSIFFRDPANAKELIRGVANPRLRIEAARVLTRPGNVGAEDLPWAESLGTEVEYAPVVGDVFVAWSRQDAQGAVAALGRYPRGPARRGRPRPPRGCHPLGFRPPGRGASLRCHRVARQTPRGGQPPPPVLHAGGPETNAGRQPSETSRRTKIRSAPKPSRRFASLCAGFASGPATPSFLEHSPRVTTFPLTDVP